MRRNTQDAVQKTRRAKQAAADRKTESSSISFICTAHKIPTATMRPSGLKVMYNTQRPKCGYRTGPGRQSKERRKRRERKKNLNLSEEKRCSRTWNSHHTRGSAVVQISRVWDTQTSCPVWHQQPGSKSLQSTSFPTLMLTMNSTKGSSTQLNA